MNYDPILQSHLTDEDLDELFSGALEDRLAIIRRNLCHKCRKLPKIRTNLNAIEKHLNELAYEAIEGRAALILRNLCCKCFSVPGIRTNLDQIEELLVP